MNSKEIFESMLKLNVVPFDAEYIRIAERAVRLFGAHPRLSRLLPATLVLTNLRSPELRLEDIASRLVDGRLVDKDKSLEVARRTVNMTFNIGAIYTFTTFFDTRSSVTRYRLYGKQPDHRKYA